MNIAALLSQDAQHTPTTAQRILSRTDLTPREQNEMLDILHKRFARVSQDMDQYWFRDESSLLVQHDENLRPIEMIEVTQ